MARKGQVGVFTLLFLDLTFIVLWAVGLGAFVSTFAAQAVATGNLEGVELFLIANMNFFIWLIFIIVNLVGYVSTTGGNQ